MFTWLYVTVDTRKYMEDMNENFIEECCMHPGRSSSLHSYVVAPIQYLQFCNKVLLLCSYSLNQTSFRKQVWLPYYSFTAYYCALIISISVKDRHAWKHNSQPLIHYTVNSFLYEAQKRCPDVLLKKIRNLRHLVE